MLKCSMMYIIQNIYVPLDLQKVNYHVENIYFPNLATGLNLNLIVLFSEIPVFKI